MRLGIPSSPVLGSQVGATILAIFMQVQGIELRSSCLQSKYFTDGATSPARAQKIAEPGMLEVPPQAVSKVQAEGKVGFRWGNSSCVG